MVPCNFAAQAWELGDVSIPGENATSFLVPYTVWAAVVHLAQSPTKQTHCFLQRHVAPMSFEATRLHPQIVCSETSSVSQPAEKTGSSNCFCIVEVDRQHLTLSSTKRSK
jgi:hypothetical protein